MTKLLLVTTVPATLHAFLLPYADHFRSQGWRVDCLCNGATESDLCREHFDQCHHVGWSRSPLDPSNFLRYPRRIRDLATRERYQIVHVHTPVASFVTRFALRQIRSSLGIRVIYTAHGFHFYKGGPALRNALFLGLERIAASWTDHLIVINREDHEAALRYLLPPDRVTLMPGVGLDLDYYDPNRIPPSEVEAARRSIGLGTGDPLFLMIAEFNPGKRHRDLITALGLLQRRGLRPHVALAGKGPLEEAVRSQAQQLGIADHVHFLGFQRDVRPWILASCATVLPSEREGLPRSIMESLALGVPVIGTDARGVRDLLPSGCTPVPVGDVSALAQELETHLRRPGLLRGDLLRQEQERFDVRRVLPSLPY